MKSKRMLAVSLSVILSLTTLAGCGGGTSSKNNATGSKDASGAEEPFKISVMIQDFEGSPNSGEHADEVMKRLEEYTNCDLDIQWVPSDTYEDKMGITLAQGDDMPMIMFVKMNSGVISAAKAGAFWDVTDMITDSEKFPNLSKANPNVNKAVTIDGKLLGVYTSKPVGRYGWGYRQDWADKLGLEEPKTVEDLYNMCYQFTYGDPDGNGKDDTYGICLCKYMGPLDIMQTWFGCGNGWVEEGGELIPIHQTEEYMEALNWFRKMYEDGLIYSDFAVRDTNTWIDGMYNGQCGVLVDTIGNARKVWDYFVDKEIPSVTGDGFASMKLMNGLAKDENSEPTSLALAGYGGVFTITKAVKTEEDVMKCLQFLDKMNDNEMFMLTNYGLEGIHWEEKDGYLVDLDINDKAASKAYTGLNQLGSILPNPVVTDPPLKKEERMKIFEQLEADAEKIVKFNPAIGYLNNSETFSMNGASLESILQEARTKYIVGQIDEKGLQDAWNNWAAQGGSKMIEEINEQYRADQ